MEPAERSIYMVDHAFLSLYTAGIMEGNRWEYILLTLDIKFCDDLNFNTENQF